MSLCPYAYLRVSLSGFLTASDKGSLTTIGESFNISTLDPLLPTFLIATLCLCTLSVITYYSLALAWEVFWASRRSPSPLDPSAEVVLTHRLLGERANLSHFLKGEKSFNLAINTEMNGVYPMLRPSEYFVYTKLGSEYFHHPPLSQSNSCLSNCITLLFSSALSFYYYYLHSHTAPEYIDPFCVRSSTPQFFFFSEE